MAPFMRLKLVHLIIREIFVINVIIITAEKALVINVRTVELDLKHM